MNKDKRLGKNTAFAGISSKTESGSGNQKLQWWMDGWIDERMDGWNDERMDGWMDGLMGGLTEKWKEGWTNRITANASDLYFCPGPVCSSPIGPCFQREL